MGAKVTLHLLEKYLEQFGWDDHEAVDEPGERGGYIRTGWVSGDDRTCHHMVIDLEAEHGRLSFEVPRVLDAPMNRVPQGRLKNLMVTLMCLNDRHALGKFAYDPADGRVSFSVDVPVDDNTLSFDQFVHCLRVVKTVVNDHASVLKAILDGRETLDEALKEEAPGGLEELVRGIGELFGWAG